MALSRRRFRSARWTIALALAACSAQDEELPKGGVVHLDLRLAGGESAVSTLTARSELVRSWTARRADTCAEDLDPWELQNALVSNGRGATGILMRAEGYDPAHGIEHARLANAGEIDTTRVNIVEVDAVVGSGVFSTLSWRTSDGPGAVVEANYESGDGLATASFRLANHPQWKGRVHSLKLAPMGSGPQSFEIEAIRFRFEAFQAGHQPSSEDGESAACDGGLLGPDGDERRTWPSRIGVPAFARSLVPPGGRVAVDTALSSNVTGGAVLFTLDVRGPDGWETRAWRVAGGDGDERVWVPMVADLADRQGQVTELRFLAATDPQGAPLSEQDRGVLAYFGAPILVGEPEVPAPNVVLVTLDTTRMDAIGAYGGSLPTPVIDRLAAEGILFERAYTASNTTLPSHVSILTGLDVPNHGVLDNRSRLDPRVVTMAETLRRAGWITAAAVSVHHLSAGYSGLGAGFDEFLEFQPGAETDGALTISALTPWIDAWPEKGKPPFFLWVHLFDPHTPYGPPKWFVEQLRREHGLEAPPRASDPGTIRPSRYTREGEFLAGVSNLAHARFLYEAGVAYTDRLVGGLLARLRSKGMLERTAIVLAADHGEALGDQDVWFSHAMLYPPVVRVPLLLRLPGIEGGRRVSAPVSTTDIAPTLLGWLGVESAPGSDGRDLRDTLASGASAAGRRVWFAHSELDEAGFFEDGVHYFETLHRDYEHLGPKHVIPPGTRFLFHDASDPACARNLAEEEAPVAAEYSAAVLQWDARRGVPAGAAAPRTQAELQRLEALGYGGGADDE